MAPSCRKLKLGLLHYLSSPFPPRKTQIDCPSTATALIGNLSMPNDFVEIFLCRKILAHHLSTTIHPKKDNVCGFCFSVQKNLRKKCVNSHDKMLRQKCVNHQNKNNLVSTGIFVENILFLNAFIKK